MPPNSISVQKCQYWLNGWAEASLFVRLTFPIVLHDEIDYSYTHYIHEVHHLFSSFGIDLVSFQGKVVK